MLKKADISGGTLSGDGLTAILYNGEAFTDAVKANKSFEDFENKIKGFTNDNRGSIETAEGRSAIFREFHRGGSEVAQNDYDWIASNLHPSEAYKQRLGQPHSKGGWAKG